jgi:hypothetical protein
MSWHPSSTGSQLASRTLTPAPRAALLAAALLVLVVAVTPRLRAFELRLSTENDLFGSSRKKDDLYTFSVGVEVERGPYTITYRENAFTDRGAAVRFDESHLTVGRALPLQAPWNVYAEGGLVRIGNGLFGAAAQNDVHQLLGYDQLDLRYQGTSLHPRLAMTAERPYALSDSLAAGPRVEADSVPGLRSYAVLGGQARWQPGARVAVALLVGERFTHAADPALARHLAASAPLARVGVDFGRITLAWSYNDYGDEREHLTLGYRVGGR